MAEGLCLIVEDGKNALNWLLEMAGSDCGKWQNNCDSLEEMAKWQVLLVQDGRDSKLP